MLNLDKIFTYNITKVQSGKFTEVTIELYSFDDKYSSLINNIELVVMLTNNKIEALDNINKIKLNDFSNFNNKYDNVKKIPLLHIINNNKVKLGDLYVYQHKITLNIDSKDNMYLFSKLNFIQDETLKINYNINNKIKQNVKFEKLKENSITISDKYYDINELDKILQYINNISFKHEDYKKENLYKYFLDIRDNSEYVHLIINFMEFMKNSKFFKLLEYPYFYNLIKDNIESNKFSLAVTNGKVDYSIILSDITLFNSIKLEDNNNLLIDLQVNDFIELELKKIYNRIEKNYLNISNIYDLINDKNNYNSKLDIFTNKFYNLFDNTILVNILNDILDLCEIFNINDIDKNNLLNILNRKTFNPTILLNILTFYEKLLNIFSFFTTKSKSYNVIRDNFQIDINYNNIYQYKIFQKLNTSLEEFNNFYNEYLNYYDVGNNSKYYFLNARYILDNNLFIDALKADPKNIDDIFIKLLSEQQYDELHEKIFNILQKFNFSYDFYIESYRYQDKLNWINSPIKDAKNKSSLSNNVKLMNSLKSIIYNLFYFTKNDKIDKESDLCPPQLTKFTESFNNFYTYLKYYKMYIVEYYNPKNNTWNLLDNNSVKENILCRFSKYYNDKYNIFYTKNDNYDLFNKYFIINHNTNISKTQINKVKIVDNKLNIPQFNNKTKQLIEKIKFKL